LIILIYFDFSSGKSLPLKYSSIVLYASTMFATIKYTVAFKSRNHFKPHALTNIQITNLISLYYKILLFCVYSHICSRCLVPYVWGQTTGLQETIVCWTHKLSLPRGPKHAMGWRKYLSHISTCFV